MTDNLPEALRRDAFGVEPSSPKWAARLREAADTIEGLTAIVNAPAEGQADVLDELRQQNEHLRAQVGIQQRSIERLSRLVDVWRERHGAMKAAQVVTVDSLCAAGPRSARPDMAGEGKTRDEIARDFALTPWLEGRGRRGA